MKIDNSRDELLSKMGKETLKDRYLLPNETYQGMFKRVATAFADDDNHAQRLYDYMSQHWFMPATPILANGGSTRGQVISCFLQSIDDSMTDIIDNWSETANLAAMGGGIGVYYGNVRPVGDSIGFEGGKTSGVIPFIKVNDSLSNAVSQGNLRRGSAAAYLPVWHAEIEEFVEVRKPTGGDSNRKSLNIHHGIVIDDKFMRAVENNDTYDLVSSATGKTIKTIKARELWIKIITMRLETGEPYILWIDRLKETTPEHHKKMGLEPTQSNLCVAPETKILTKNGYKKIADLKGKKVDCWNGEDWSNVEIKQTGKEQKLVQVNFSDGTSIECTEYHKFYIQNNYGQSSIVKQTNELVVGDKLEKWDMPLNVNFSNCGYSEQELEMAYSQGFYSGDGNINRTYSFLYEEKYMCQERLIGQFGEQHNSTRRKTWRHGQLDSKTFVPDNKFSIEVCLEWLAGLFDADGTIVRSDNGDTIQLGSVEYNFLLKVKALLDLMGIKSKICFAREQGDYLLPNGKGGLSKYNCKEVNRLLINTKGTKRLLDLGLNCARLDF